MRIICCVYVAIMSCAKIYYRVVVGNYEVLVSLAGDCVMITLGLYPVFEGKRLQNLLNLDDLN